MDKFIQDKKKPNNIYKELRGTSVLIIIIEWMNQWYFFIFYYFITKVSLFYLFLKLVQINFIFSDNVHTCILYILIFVMTLTHYNLKYLFLVSILTISANVVPAKLTKCLLLYVHQTINEAYSFKLSHTKQLFTKFHLNTDYLIINFKSYSSSVLLTSIFLFGK